MDQAVSYGAFVIAIVTAIVSIYSAWLSRQTLRQEIALRTKEHAQLSLDLSYRLLIDLVKDFSQDPYLIYYRHKAAASLLKGEYSIEVSLLLGFFERMSEMVLRGTLDSSMAYSSFSSKLRYYWTAAAPLVESKRISEATPDLWEHSESVYRLFLELEARHNGTSVASAIPTPQKVERYLKEEVALPKALD